MSLARRLLWGSAVWEVARPRTPLTAGHLVIRLTNPATALDERSAADWLRCHKIARAALDQVLDATRCTLMFAYQWHALGAALGEPVAESSTPTFHLFGRWEGEPIAPGAQLRLPAHRRNPVSAEELLDTDAALRNALRAAASTFGLPVTAEPAAASRPGVTDDDTDNDHDGGADTPLPSIRTWTPEHAVHRSHTVLSPQHAVSDISAVRPGELLALASALEGIAAGRTVSGLSCLVPDPSVTGGNLELHVLGRSASETVNPLKKILDSAEISPALL
jgi:diadenosine tetraphosphate (Ap4A) HIT family hydrolase